MRSIDTRRVRALVRFVSLWGAGRRVVVHTELPIEVTTARLRGAASVATAGPFENFIPDPTDNHPLRGRLRQGRFRLEAPRGQGIAFKGCLAVDAAGGGTLVSGRMLLKPLFQVPGVAVTLLLLAKAPLSVSVIMVTWAGFVLWWWGRRWLREDRAIFSAVVAVVDGVALRGS